MRYARDGGTHAVTYEALQRFIEDLAGTFIDAGIEAGDRVAIWSGNRPEWVIAEYAAWYANATSVPLHPEASKADAVAKLQAAQPGVVLVDGPERLETVLAHRGDLEEVALIITLGPLPSGYAEKAGLSSMHEAYARGREALEADPDSLPARVEGIGPTDEASQGLGGDRVVTHASLGACVDSVVRAWKTRPEDHALLAPLASDFARLTGVWAPLSTGGTLCFIGDGEDVVDALNRVEPTVLVADEEGVDRVYRGARERVLVDGWKGRLGARALGVGQEKARCIEQGENPSPWLVAKQALAEPLGLGRARAALGGKARFVTMAGAPGEEVASFFWGIGVPLLPAYARLDAGGLVAASRPNAHRFGSVGRPLEGVQARIEGAKDEERGNVQVKAQGTQAWVDIGEKGRLDEEGFLFLSGGHRRGPGAPPRSGRP